MSESDSPETQNGSWKTKALIIGGIVGSLVGVVATYLFIQNRKEDQPPEISAGEGVKLGVLVLGLLRSIATLGEGK
jgi:hypothetical protein